MRALVTGGAGFIGSNLVDALIARGDDVVVVDDLSTGRRGNLDAALAQGAVLHELDVLEAGRLEALMVEQRPEIVFHLAAQIDVRRSASDPAADARINVEGTVNVLQAAHRCGARRVVLSSTGGAIYGDTDALPTSEDAPTRPLSPYGQAKHAAEGYCALFTRLHGLSTVALRYANVYGPRQDPLGEGGVVAIFCGRLVDGTPPTVFGDGRQTRDFVYVGDIVAANLLAAESSLTGVVNIGCGVETSVLDLVEACRPFDAHGTFVPQFAAARAEEVRRSCLAADRAARELGWTPTVGVDEGLRRTLDHVAGHTSDPSLGPS